MRGLQVNCYNPCIKVSQHPLPAAEEIFATLAGGTVFTKLDLAHTYQQLVLDEHAQEVLTINTHRGLYRYTRLPFGISSAPAMFQAVLKHILRWLNRVRCRLDDILLNDEVLTQLEHSGVKLKKSKCVFLQPYVEYLGHFQDDKGVHPLAEKTEAIRNAPRAADVSQLKSYLDLLNYYGKFMPNLLLFWTLYMRCYNRINHGRRRPMVVVVGSRNKCSYGRTHGISFETESKSWE